jgi:hypothetical protein
MIRFLLRFVGILSLALAFIFFVYDGTKSIRQRSHTCRRSGHFHESSLAQLGRP